MERNAPNVHATLFTLLIISLITFIKPGYQGVTDVSKDKSSFNMNQS